MPYPMQGRVVALAESRQLEDLARLLENERATVLRYPLVGILDPVDDGPVLAWLGELTSAKFALIVFFTGEGVRRLIAAAERHGLRDKALAALKTTRMIVRGPKPTLALREFGLRPAKIAPAPTTDGIITALREESIRGRTVGVQLFSPSNPPLEKFLREAGATLSAVLPYVYAPASDAARVAELITQMSRGEIDVLLLTSSPQIDRLFEVADDQHLQAELAAAWQRTRIAAIGPIVADNLRRRGAPVAICPQQGFVMKNLVKCIRESFEPAPPAA
jgi:uroporphyrinogen-III synthase